MPIMAKSKKIKTEVKTDYGVYGIILEPEPDMGGYMITVPKRPAAITWGKNQAHAKKMAREAIECCVEGDILIAAEREGAISIHRKQTAAMA